MPDSGAELGHRLTAELTTLAMCWRIVRLDGVALGFTTHDRSLLIDGMLYDSAPGMTPSAVVRSDALEVDVMEVAGALRANAISAADLGNGRYDGAEVRLFMVDWRDGGAGQQLLARGTLGSIETGTGPDAGFAATVRGPTAALAAIGIETYSPECRAELGDWRCRVSMRGRTVRAVTVFADGEWIGVAGVDDAAASDFLAGQVRVLSGPLAGLDRSIVAVAGALLRLDEPLAVSVGVMAELRQGCDKQFATCTARFGNSVNFRGEPHVPGGDVLTRFGGF